MKNGTVLVRVNILSRTDWFIHQKMLRQVIGVTDSGNILCTTLGRYGVNSLNPRTQVQPVQVIKDGEVEADTAIICRVVGRSA